MKIRNITRNAYLVDQMCYFLGSLYMVPPILAIFETIGYFQTMNPQITLILPEQAEIADPCFHLFSFSTLWSEVKY